MVRGKEFVAARRTGRIGQQLDGRVSVALRNLAIRLTPASIAVKGMVKQAAWEPPALGRGDDYRNQGVPRRS